MNARFVYLRKPDSSVPDRIEGIRMMARMLDELGIDRKRCRSVSMTQVTGKRQPNAKDIEAGKEQFLKDMGEEPVIIVLMGSKVVNAISKKITMDCCRGEPVPIDDTMPYPKGSLLYCMFDPSVLMSDPGKEDLFQRDVRHLASLMNGTPEANPPVDNILVHEPGELDAFTSLLPGIWESLPPDERLLVVDCEWHGKNWMEPGHYIRTVQIGYAPGKAITVELYRENPAFDDPGHEWPRKSADRKAEIRRLLDEPQSACPDIIGMWKSLKKLLQDSGLPIIGHNIIADWQWLLTFGVDIRNNVVYDTMLAEHLINSDGPFRLDEVAIRRTKFGRYCMDVDMWVHNHREFCQEGYGAVPHRLILPYGGCDVECPRQIMHAQYPILKEYGMLDPRGPNGEYPSLLDSTLLNQLATDEFERNGLPVDRERLTSLIDSYQGMRSQLLSQITLMAMKEGMAEFNPNSQPQMRELLFGKLGLTPVKTTGGQNWGDTVGRYEMDSEDMPASSTDKSVLEMLQNEHPLVKKMLQFRRIDQACKTWLRHPDEDGEGGLESQLWSDGKLHPSFLPLTSTGRYKTSNPNSQNFPKKADGYLKEIFGEDNVPPMLRTIVAPPEGWMMMEGDFCQAELFTMANISGDENMIRLLTTPGLDLHDSTTLSSFGMKMIDENDNEVTEDDLVALAARIGAGSDEFQHYMKAMRYLQMDGKIITRSEFKSGPRISAKSLNFGIPLKKIVNFCNYTKRK